MTTIETFQKALDGDLINWRGLPALTREILRDALAPVKNIHEATEEVRITQRYEVIVFERETVPYRIEAWFLYGDTHAALLEYDDPVIPNIQSVLDGYGYPEAVLVNKRYAPDAVVKEYVYAERGITLSVAESSVEGGSKAIIHVQLYPSTSLAYYITDIGAGPELRPYPLRLEN